MEVCYTRMGHIACIMEKSEKHIFPENKRLINMVINLSGWNVPVVASFIGSDFTGESHDPQYAKDVGQGLSGSGRII